MTRLGLALAISLIAIGAHAQTYSPAPGAALGANTFTGGQTITGGVASDQKSALLINGSIGGTGTATYAEGVATTCASASANAVNCDGANYQLHLGNTAAAQVNYEGSFVASMFIDSGYTFATPDVFGYEACNSWVDNRASPTAAPHFTCFGADAINEGSSGAAGTYTHYQFRAKNTGGGGNWVSAAGQTINSEKFEADMTTGTNAGTFNEDGFLVTGDGPASCTSCFAFRSSSATLQWSAGGKIIGAGGLTISGGIVTLNGGASSQAVNIQSGTGVGNVNVGNANDTTNLASPTLNITAIPALGSTGAAIPTCTVTSGGALVTCAPNIASRTISGLAGTTSTTAVMDGINLAFTPRRSGTMLFTVQGNATNPATGDGCTVQLSYGTGTAPINGAALTGTQVGAIAAFSSVTNSGKWPITVSFPVSALTIGTAYWLDVAFAATTGGTCTYTAVGAIAREL